MIRGWFEWLFWECWLIVAKASLWIGDRFDAR